MQTKHSSPGCTLGWQQQRDEAVAKEAAAMPRKFLEGRKDERRRETRPPPS